MFQRTFVFSALPARVLFGAGTLSNLPNEIDELGVGRALVVCTPEQSDLGDTAARMIGDRCIGVFPGAIMHVPVETARQARVQAHDAGADCVVAIGGGSAIGLAKAIALESGIQIVAIPTTYAGSEMTPIYGITENGTKKTGRDLRVLPRAVIYDPELTLSLPTRMSATSGMNAIAHCVEALYATNANPVTSIMAEEGIRYLARALPRIVERPRDIDARAECLYGAWLAGSVLATTSVALHHKLCHTLGGMLNLPHAETHTVVLPHATAYNASAAAQAMGTIRRALESRDAAQGLFDLASQLDVPVALKALGVRFADLDRVADAALAAPYPNPRPMERDAIRSLLEDAYWGCGPPAARSGA